MWTASHIHQPSLAAEMGMVSRRLQLFLAMSETPTDTAGFVVHHVQWTDYGIGYFVAIDP